MPSCIKLIKMKICYNILFFIILSFSEINGQTESGTRVSEDSLSRYEFNLSLKPQEGYGFLFGYRGGPISQKPEEKVPERHIFEFGVVTTKEASGSEGGILDKSLSVEINEIEGRYYYGLVAGFNIRYLANFGLSYNLVTNFQRSWAFLVRPHFGFPILPPWGSAYCEILCDISLIKPNFDIISHWLIGIRYNIGIIKKNRISKKI